MLLKIKTPEEFYCDRNLISKVGEICSRYGRGAYIIAGKTAYSAVFDDLEGGLKAYHIDYSVNIMEGYPTYEKVIANSSKAYIENADFVIGIGGGKICDVAKAVANMRNIPVVMVPTVAATCACWAARSVIYKDDGNFDQILWNKNNPNIIVADLDVLTNAPKRYLAAGILDTLAKWYEFKPLIDSAPEDVVLRQDVAIAKLAYDIILEHGLKTYKGDATLEEFDQVIEAIFFLAGASGSFANGKAFRGFAHSYYYASTHIPSSRHRLHGEKVAFGLLVQAILKKDQATIEELLDLLQQYDLNDTPYDWEDANIENTIFDISNYIIKESPVVVEKGFVKSVEECADAIETASNYIRA
ncbi:iron-containing alcohol dehydrogenase family protein [Pseudobutyrivibrio sp.]|uniref:iron-containing alcohol dehydrogenase family protein n=1 Tax=Pseudobutyrivibrio sp. TaxID=2014367 RepID=UPI001DC1694F|nr:iron-containing alcohol dehydrogenase family protein [Pseudobutyrivibrio sp.]MBE5911197.1 iron-containing alcohol dehydrogenase family protein [Pseudobutyrivibrio sp.]